MRSDLLGALDGAAVFKVRRDAGGPEGVAGDFCLELRCPRAPLHHLPHLGPVEEPLAQGAATVEGREQGLPAIGGEQGTGCLKVGIHISLDIVVGG